MRKSATNESVLVTGGAGLLGSHLCERLLQQGKFVICLDNLSTGSLRNIAHLFENLSFSFVKHDVTSPFSFEVDDIFNLACPASPAQYQRRPVHTTKTSVLGAIHALELAERVGARILQASTSEVYGDPLVHPQKEDYWGHVNSVGVRACYDEGKRCAETLFFDYRRHHGVRTKIARIFNTYGPRMDPMDGRVVSNLIIQALRGEPLTIFGDGNQTRSFCYVDDLIDGLLCLMDAPDSFSGPVNLGNPDEFTILMLANQVIELTGSRSEVEFLPLPQDDPRQRQPDIGLASRVLRWRPEVDLKTGLARTIDYFRERLAVSTDDHAIWRSKSRGVAQIKAV